MKTMTCREMGGPCDEAFHGETSEEIMNAGAAHLKEMAQKGDEGHMAAQKMMDDASTNPDAAKVWGDKFEADFAAKPEDQ